jgi:hypothetical protein
VGRFPGEAWTQAPHKALGLYRFINHIISGFTLSLSALQNASTFEDARLCTPSPCSSAFAYVRSPFLSALSDSPSVCDNLVLLVVPPGCGVARPAGMTTLLGNRYDFGAPLTAPLVLSLLALLIQTPILHQV